MTAPQLPTYPSYRAHKIVQAFKIRSIAQSEAHVAIPGGSWKVYPEDSTLHPAHVTHAWYEKHRPAVGGYLVQYSDGYQSFSPAKPFEDGYTLESAAMTFGHALELLKKGAKVARAGWNGKGMWLSMSGPLEGRLIPSTAFWSKNNADYAAQQSNDQAVVLPCITMKTADGCILMGWLASQTDMLAEDWVVVL